ncbi:hypothetical protein JGU72_10150 [Antrihabitans sp. YC2-6]|nr:hypothetical protein [Antrihabitans sp. YC2-6]
MVELSGVIVGDGVIYGMADSGADDKLAVLNADCTLNRWIPNPVDPFDVEDLQFFDGQLWLSDTGDNRRVRPTIALTRIDPASGAGELHRLTYPDGPHDAEALLIDSSGIPIVVTKEALGVGGVYRPVEGRTVADLPSPGPTMLEKVGLVDLPGPITGGAVSADGKVAALRTYSDAFLYWAPEGDIAAALTSGRGFRIALPRQPQGEAIAFDRDGGLVIGSESTGALQPLQVLRNADDLVRPADHTEPAASSSGDRNGLVIGGIAAAVVVAAIVAWRGFR